MMITRVPIFADKARVALEGLCRLRTELGESIMDTLGIITQRAVGIGEVHIFEPERGDDVGEHWKRDENRFARERFAVIGAFGGGEVIFPRPKFLGVVVPIFKVNVAL